MLIKKACHIPFEMIKVQHRCSYIDMISMICLIFIESNESAGVYQNKIVVTTAYEV